MLPLYLSFLLSFPTQIDACTAGALIGPNQSVISNRTPLAKAPFTKLLAGQIKPTGWLRTQLKLEADGFSGRLTEISPWLKKENNAWLAPDGKGEHGWEEVPYWLRGFIELGYVLNDKRILDESKVWIDGILGSQRPDGWFGPEANRTASNGKPDMWANMPVLDALRSYYEHTHDKRVIPFLTRYFQFQMNLPEQDMFLSYWEPQRVGDNMESVYWLYNRTGMPWLIDLVEKLHRRSADWVHGVPDWHGVNMPQGLREPAMYALKTKNPNHTAASDWAYRHIREIYGQVPGGLYGADENARKGFGDPRQAAETCAMAEMMRTCESLVNLTGDTTWADRCEDVAFNSLPASMTPDLKALHYLTSPNMTRCTASSKAPGLQNSGPMQLFDPYDHRCCQHNAAMAWPLYAESLWTAVGGNGLAAMFFAPCEVTTKVGNGSTVTIHEETNYPFTGTVKFTVKAAKPTAFPLVLRIPGWVQGATVTAPGGKPYRAKGGAFVRLRRTWKNGDQVLVQLPRKVQIQTWKANKDSVSVNYGPLTFSLKIGQKYDRVGGTDRWPASELTPTTAWNFGLASVKSADFVVHERPMPKDGQPFTPENAPIVIDAKARQIPGWQEDYLGLVGLLQASPALTTQPLQKVQLIPMGAARLRISQFPVVSATKGTVWVAPGKPKKSLPTKASHVFTGDTVTALTDGLIPANSGDLSIPRFTWWDHKGTDEWVEVELPVEKTLTGSEVYWFSDESTGGECRLPQTWRISYWDGSEWKPVEALNGYPVLENRFSKVEFRPVKTKRLRIDAKLRENVSGGILEWRFLPGI